MKAQSALCQVCVWQERHAEDPAKRTCTSPHAVLDDDTCTGFLLPAGEDLGHRLAELVNMIEIAWDVIMSMLDKATQLPPVRTHEPLNAPQLFRHTLDAEQLLDQCGRALDDQPDLAQLIGQWKATFNHYLERQEVT